jgi:hypothetical protein
VQVISSFERLLERNRTIGCMQVEDIHAVGLQLSQGLVQHLFKDRGLVCTWLSGIPFGSNCQTSFLPVCLGSERLLFATNIDTGRVYFVIALALKVVEALVILVKGSDTSS